MKKLCSILESSSWKRVGSVSGVVAFVKAIPHKRFGHLLFTVRIVVSQIDGRFLCCQLFGVKIDGRSGALKTNVLLSEWTTQEGATAAIIGAFDSAVHACKQKELRYLSTRRKSKAGTATTV
jgi:hypothetical protein